MNHITTALLTLFIGFVLAASCNLDITDLSDEFRKAQSLRDAQQQALREYRFQIGAAKACGNAGWATDEDGAVHCRASIKVGAL